MKRRFAGLGLCAGILFAAPAFSQATIGGEWRDDVARFAERVVEEGLAPGLAVAVSKGEWVLYSRGFGVADANTGRRVSEDTAFYIASSTKALTATAVVLLADRGEMDLQAPVARYIPGLELKAPLDASKITLERLLTLTHGIEDGGPVVVRTAYTGDFSAGLLIRLLADYDPAESGNAFAYGNLGYNILGLALDPEDGQGWKEAVRREVLEPLGMNGTSARISTLDPERIAYPHWIVSDRGWERIRLDKADGNLHAAGGHFTSARDLIRFTAAHASDGRLEGRRVFPAAAIASTHEPHVEQDRSFGPFQRFGWGYGWDLAHWEGRTIVQRFGSFSGYRSHMSFELDSRVGVVVLTNGAGIASPATDLVATYIYDRLLGKDDIEAAYDRQLEELEAKAQEYESAMAAQLAEHAKRLAPLSHPVDDFAGVYENPEFGRAAFLAVGGGLDVRIGIAASRAEVYDASADQLRIRIGGGVVAGFEFPDGGGPATAVVIQGERFERVEP